MAATRNLGMLCGLAVAGLALVLAASAPAKADRGRDSVWLGTPAKPVAKAPQRRQAARLSLAEPGRPTFDLRAARHLLIAQLPPADDRPESKDWMTDFRSLDGSEVAVDTVDPEFEDIEDSDADFEDDPVSDIDPLESINRPIFEANLFLDRWILRPVTRVYIETVPAPGRRGVSNFLDNLRTPVILFNDLLQGEFSRAGATFGRFFINSFFGLAGLVDTADALGLPGHSEDFGQTLGSYGMGGKPYLMLPLFGPSNPRDAIGKVGDIVFDPLTYLTPDALSEVETGIKMVSDRSKVIKETDSLESTSIDYYAAVRSFYYQNRDFEISNGRAKTPSPVVLEDQGLYDDLEDEELEGLEEDLQL